MFPISAWLCCFRMLDGVTWDIIVFKKIISVNPRRKHMVAINHIVVGLWEKML